MADYQNEREIVLEIIMQVLEEGNPSHIVIRRALDKYDWMEERSKAFISKVSLATMDHLYRIDGTLDAYSNTPVSKMKPFIRSLLRMSVCQLLYMEKVPASAVCNEAVKLAKAHSFTKLSGFVNGVLRAIARANDAGSLNCKSAHSGLSLSYSMPEWIVDICLESYGRENTEKILKSFTLKEKSRITLSALKGHTGSEIAQMLCEEGVEAEADADDLKLAHVVGNMNSPAEKRVIREGYAIIQDKSSALAADIAAAFAGPVVIDACAAPGGKSMILADRLGNMGTVYSCDISDYKCNLIRENVSRVGLMNVKVLNRDATKLNTAWVEKADLVLADLPCSGLGIMGGKPDIRYHMTSQKEQELVKLQRDMLSVLQTYVKPKGVLFYSTCTIHPSENRSMRNWFLNTYDFEPVDLNQLLPERYRRESASEGFCQLLPGIDDTDGFFFAAFRKKSV